MRLAVMVCARRMKHRSQDQLPWFLNFFGLKAGRILHQVEKGEGVENAGVAELDVGILHPDDGVLGRIERASFG